jgi:hypothetical protein
MEQTELATVDPEAFTPNAYGAGQMDDPAAISGETDADAGHYAEDMK